MSGERNMNISTQCSLRPDASAMGWAASCFGFPHFPPQWTTAWNCEVNGNLFHPKLPLFYITLIGKQISILPFPFIPLYSWLANTVVLFTSDWKCSPLLAGWCSTLSSILLKTFPSFPFYHGLKVNVAVVVTKYIIS